jgi:hypothetical protein
MPPPRRRREAGDRFRDAPSPIEVSRCNDDCGLDCAAGKRDLGAVRQFSAVIAVTFPERTAKQRVAVQRSNKLIYGGSFLSEAPTDGDPWKIGPVPA